MFFPRILIVPKEGWFGHHKHSTLSGKSNLTLDRSFIFSTFYDKPITSLFILRIQVGSSSADACLDMFYSSAPYPPKEGRAKSTFDVSPWILPISFVKSLMQSWFPWSTNECQRIMAFWHSFFIFSLLLVLFLLILFL